MSSTVTVPQKITSTALFLPFSTTRGGEGAPRMGTWRPGEKDPNTAEPALPPPMAPRERSLRDASVHIRAPLSSILQDNENSKKLYSVLATQENLFALMLTEMISRVITTPPPKPNS